MWWKFVNFLKLKARIYARIDEYVEYGEYCDCGFIGIVKLDENYEWIGTDKNAEKDDVDENGDFFVIVDLFGMVNVV